MENYNYPSNSHKSKEMQKEQRNIQKVVTGEVKTKKKSEASKLVSTFISEDIGKVKEYILQDVLVPAIKKAISDIVTNGIDMILYGGSGRPGKSSIPGTKVSYVNYSQSSMQPRVTAQRSMYTYDDIVYPNRGDAEAVLSQMDDIIAQYGTVRVADMFELSGITGNYTDNNYGWKDIRSARVERVRDGYIIKMPVRPMALD